MDLFISGDIQVILQGHVTHDTLRPVSVQTIVYALGGAALPGSSTLEVGETMVYEATGHIFTAKGAWTGTDSLQAAFLMGIDRKPKERFQLAKRQTIQSLYEDLVKTYPKGFVIVGSGHFSKLSVAYLKRSPIYGEDINALQDKYWHAEKIANREAQLFGVVLPQPEPRAFYHNPNESKQPVLPSHTHVLAPLARHLLTDSELVSGTFWIEPIDAVKSF